MQQEKSSIQQGRDLCAICMGRKEAETATDLAWGLMHIQNSLIVDLEMH